MNHQIIFAVFIALVCMLFLAGSSPVNAQYYPSEIISEASNTGMVSLMVLALMALLAIVF